MRLRKTLDSLKAQNWIAVFLDFVLVVVGVYLGLMLNNAQGDAHTKQRADASLNMLLEDVSSELNRLDYVSASQRARIEALQRITDILGAKDIDEAGIAKNWDEADQNSRTFLARDTIYDAMQQDDELYSLPADLRRLISVTYAADFKFLATSTIQYWNNQDSVRVNCTDRYWDMEAKKLISRAPEDVARLRNCFSSLRDYSEFYEHLTADVHRSNAEKLRAALEQRLGKHFDAPSAASVAGAASPPAKN